MSEEEAEVLACDGVPRETADRLRHFVALLRAEAAHQNLVSATTLDHIWQRHILDSTQLLPHGKETGSWIDIGSGAGLPGIVIALLRDAPTMLIEPRAKRSAFLQGVIEALGLEGRATVSSRTAASTPAQQASVVSARAVASLDALFTMGQRFATAQTLWVLPKGRGAADELAVARASWQGDFRLVPSRTDSGASIVVARGVKRK